MADKIWYKRVLIPLWVVQILISLAVLASAALALWVTRDNEINLDGAQVQVLDTGAAVNLAFSLATILMALVEMILVCAHRLSPVLNIVFQSIKSAIWTVYLIFMIRAAVLGVYSGLTIFLVVAIFLTCICQLIYGARIMHRHRKGTLYRGNYAPAGAGGTNSYNHSPFAENVGIATPQPDPFRDPSHTSYGYTSQAPPAGASSDYYAPNHVQQSYEMQSNSKYQPGR